MTEEKFPGEIKISLEKAQKWVKNYKDPKAEVNSKKIDAYLIPLESLSLVLAQDIDAVRAYVGVNDLGEQTLLFVGTKLNKETGIYVDVFSKGVVLENGTEEVVYDGGRPCPPYGDPESPMNI
jgi:hypothetical protein